MLAARAMHVGAPAYTESFPRTPESVGLARRLTMLSLDVWHLEDLADTALLVCSELVTNSVDHATSASMRLTVTRTAERSVRVAVSDRSRRLPMLLSGDSDGESGRGLILVDTLATKWGTDTMRWGKRVWADLDAP